MMPQPLPLVRRYASLAAGSLVAGAIAGLVWFSACSTGGHVSAAEPGARGITTRQASSPSSIANGNQREREGTSLVDVPGHFKLTGDRATFFPKGSENHYLALENLTLERIAIAISDIPDPPSWVVSGTVTEYRGANFLLVTKAILQNAPAAPARPVNSSEPAAPPRGPQAY